MSKQQKQFWKGLAEKEEHDAIKKDREQEFGEEVPIDNLLQNSFFTQKTPRRNFLKLLGFSTTAATVAASCEIPVKKAIPYVIKPDEIVPGKALWYASTFFDGEDYANVLVKTREGRPIKIEGNEMSGINKGGTSAKTQASVLELYDMERLKGPKQKGKDSDWKTIDREVITQLKAIKDKEGQIVLLTSSVISPSTKAVIKKFKEQYPNTRHVTYDPCSVSAILDANKADFDKRAVPTYRFDKANMIVSVGADFLGTWISPVEYARQYGKGRKVTKDNPTMSRHVQFESILSLTGTNADKRVVIQPDEHTAALAQLYNEVAKKAGAPTISAPSVKGKEKDIAKTAQELWKNKGKALVVAGTNDLAAQQITNAINDLLGSYGNTVDLKNQANLRQSNDKAVHRLVDEMGQGKIDALLLGGVNPLYDSPLSDQFEKGIKKVGLTVSFNDRMDETTSLVQYACPDHHYLESWNDTEPRKGFFGLTQPAIRPLFNTRQYQESLLKWSGQEISYHQFMKRYWKKNIYSKQKEDLTFSTFWTNSVQNGVFALKQDAKKQPAYNGDVRKAAQNLKSGAKGTKVVLYQKVGIGTGKHANNPWLQEMPDPISKITWDNYLMVSEAFAKENGLTNAISQSKGLNPETDVVAVKANGHKIELPVYIQPGLAPNTVAVALGYGRTKAGKAGNKIGANAYPLAKYNGEHLQYWNDKVSIEKTGKTHEFAQTQLHHNLHGRPIVKDATLDEYKQDPYAGNEEYKDKEEIHHLKETTLYPEREYEGNHWGMSIDLNACIGCSACTIACQAENNVPVVGKEEVKRKHEMHWLRIDRYYSGDEDNPEVVHQPMLCQHCDHAPCENVCPVAATNHSSDGLNQMIYNRCVGTKYCMNNCPYKVRRFNWYDYTGTDAFPWNEHIEEGAMANSLARMVLNPDVTVRSRGVMEKCSFCVQRIQEGKLQAKKENRQIEDGEVKTACQQACPTNAITFGDMNDEDSEVHEEQKDTRSYHVLHEYHTLPSVSYKTKIRNKEKDEDSNIS